MEGFWRVKVGPKFSSQQAWLLLGLTWNFHLGLGGLLSSPRLPIEA